MDNSSVAVVILAAGKGTRMKSAKAKVLHEVHYQAMVAHVLDATAALLPTQKIVVVGHQAQQVQEALAKQDCVFARQEQQLGTGDAVLAAENAMANDIDTVMILCGDTPVIQSSTLTSLLARHQEAAAPLTLVTTVLQDPTNYGRIIRDKKDRIIGIVEEKDASEEQRQINEVNAGIYCVNRDFLFRTLRTVDSNNQQQEVYLTDIAKKAFDSGQAIEGFLHGDATELLGVNSRSELARAEQLLQSRRNEELMAAGVSMVAPQNTRVSPDCSIAKDTVLESGVHLSKGTIVAENCRIGQGSVLENCTIAKNVSIGPSCFLVNQVIAEGTAISPLTLRQG